MVLCFFLALLLFSEKFDAVAIDEEKEGQLQCGPGEIQDTLVGVTILEPVSL